MSTRRSFLSGAATAGLGAAAGIAVGRSTAPAQQPTAPGSAEALNAAALGVIGDGRADDGANLERIFGESDTAGRGMSLRLPPGEYRIPETLTVPAGVSLALEPGATLTGGGRVQVEGEIAAGLHPIFAGVTVQFAPGRLQWAVPQWWGARGDGVHDDTDALQAGLNARILFVPAGRYRTTRELVLENRSTIVGVGNSWSPTPTTDSWIQYDGPEDDDVAVLRASTTPVGADPESALTNVHVEKIVLDGGNRAGYGLYSVYCTNDSTFTDLTARHCTRHGVLVSQQWYASYRNVVARDNGGCGIAIGYLFDGWNDRGVNGVEFVNLRASGNGGGRRFDEAENPREGCGVLFRPGAGTTLRQVVAEKNHAAGIVYDLGPRCSNRVDGAYLEGNGVEARANGATRAWGLIVIGHRNARANSISSVYLHGAVGADDAQSVWLAGDQPAGPLTMTDLSYGHYLHADWGRYTLAGYVYHGLTQHVIGRQPGSGAA